MHEYTAFFLCALLTLAFGLFSRVSEKYWLTGPMLFTFCGMVLSPMGFDLVDVNLDTRFIKLTAELTLVIVLFTDATDIKRSHLNNNNVRIDSLLLTVGLPLTVFSGFVIGYLMFPELGILSLLILALILSPTDAALGQALLKAPKLPENVRQNISIESGLNDGICLPPIVVCIALLSTADIEQSGFHWLQFLLLQLSLGPLVGFVIGRFGGKSIELASKKGWMSPVFQRMSALSLAILAFTVSEIVHGNGFIAAFTAGLFLGTKSGVVRRRLQEFGEAEGQQLTLFIFLIFGLILVPFASQYWSLKAVIYACLSLTIIRMIPVYIALIRSATSAEDKFIYSWFGPRGIASVLYLLLFIGDVGIDNYEFMLSTIVLTVLLSIFLHGASATPLVNWYENKLKSKQASG